MQAPVVTIKLPKQTLGSAGDLVPVFLVGVEEHATEREGSALTPMSCRQRKCRRCSALGLE